MFHRARWRPSYCVLSTSSLLEGTRSAHFRFGACSTHLSASNMNECLENQRRMIVNPFHQATTGRNHLDHTHCAVCPASPSAPSAISEFSTALSKLVWSAIKKKLTKDRKTSGSIFLTSTDSSLASSGLAPLPSVDLFGGVETSLIMSMNLFAQPGATNVAVRP